MLSCMFMAAPTIVRHLNKTKKLPSAVKFHVFKAAVCQVKIFLLFSVTTANVRLISFYILHRF